MTAPSHEQEGAGIRLAVYGTLAPGKPNHHHLQALRGEWRDGFVRGRLVESGWGARLGYAGLVLDDTAPPVAVQLFTSPDLPEHWPRLDAFEGADYRRVVASIETASGPMAACIYVLAGDNAP